MRRVVGLTLACVVLVLAWVSLAQVPAGASCAGESSIEDAMAAVPASGEPVFVGTVVSTRNPISWPSEGGEWATFAVEEVWAGEVPDEVEVKGGPQHDIGDGRFQSISDTRFFIPGVRYLVFPYRSPSSLTSFDFAEPGGLSDMGCTATREWSDAFAIHRPGDARIVARTEPIEILGAFDGPSPAEGPPWPWIGAIWIFVVIVAAGGLLAWRSGRTSDPVEDADIDDLIEHDRHRAGLD